MERKITGKEPLGEPKSCSAFNEAVETKWARFVREIEEGSFSLGDYAEQFKKDCAEFRRNFRFKHDEPDEEDEQDD